MDRRKSEHSEYRNDHKMDKLDGLLIDIQKKLRDSISPLSIDNLNSYERKRVHSFFDNRSDFTTKTYRDGEQYILKVYPTGNLKKMADENARKAMETGQSVFLENLGGFERFVIHEHLQSYDGIETVSSGEGMERKLEIKANQFGRSLKKIIRRIKLV